ncbi:MAG TPA: hypothetical protein VHO29_00265 [Marmoricola sp.]|nr:hypothetical protein [Marmoricola sp.]
MNDDAGSEDGGLDGAAPTNHRRSGPSAIRRPPRDRGPVTFGQVLRANPREVMALVVAALIALTWGVRTAVVGEPAGERILGAVGVLGALLLLASYVLRFWRPVLDEDRWSRSRPRRLARFVLLNAWEVSFIAACVVVAGAFLVGWRP